MSGEPLSRPAMWTMLAIVLGVIAGGHALSKIWGL